MSCNYNHVGLLVADVDAAIAKFSRLLGVRFLAPIVLPSQLIWHGVRLEHDLRISVSTEPPYIELMEGHDSGYFSLERGEGFHHLGLWAPEYGSPGWIDRFGEFRIEATIPFESGATTAFISPEACHGVRVELQDPRLMPGFHAWIAGASLAL
jgi:catechol 2,3-dioxygenase-like lactoylglutathione lyase family enzyme